MEKNELINFQDVEKRLIWLDGQRVLLDFAVAKLYGVETREVLQAVKNNSEKFPDGYLKEVPLAVLKVQTSNFLISGCSQNEVDEKIGPRTRHPRKAFTEKGLYMLATILKSSRATETTIAIIEAFATMRELSRTIGKIAASPDAAEQKALVRKGGEMVADLFGQDLQTTDTETEIELNFAVLKLKHKFKRKK